MRIRRPPPGQPRIPYLLPWDPQPPSPPASRAPPPPPGDKQQGEEGDELDLHPADLGDSSSPLRRLALPQDGAVERSLLDAHQEEQQQEPADEGRSSRKRAPPSPERKEKEGSRCSRKNGRGWRCSQPTPKGFALCEYHLGKGAMKSESAETGRRGTGQLGRTEHFNKTPAVVVAPATAIAPKADVAPPSPPSMTSTTAAPKADEPPPPPSV